MMKLSDWTDTKVEHIIGNLLRVGVFLAAVVVTCGAVVYLAHNAHAPADYRVFHGEPTELREIKSIFQQAATLDGRGLIQLGLLLLIATPVARVAFSMFGFAVEKDRMYVAFTAIVLAVLLYSMAGSL